MRVAAGAIARKYLRERLGVSIHGYLAQMGPMVLEPVDPASAYDNPFFCPDPGRIKELEDLIWRMREAGDSIGARVTVIANGVPPGLGEPVFERLDADLASAMMGINAVKGVEIGAGFSASSSGVPSIATSSPRRASRAIMRAACSAASPPARRSWSASR